MIRIAIAEPSPMLRHGLGDMLRELPDVEIIFSTDNLNALSTRISALHPDILILNPQLYEYARRATLRTEFDHLPNLRLVGLITAYTDSQHLKQFSGLIELNDETFRGRKIRVMDHAEQNAFATYYYVGSKKQQPSSKLHSFDSIKGVVREVNHPYRDVA